MSRIAITAALVWAIFSWVAPADAENAVQLTPVYIDRGAGYVYFLVGNRGDRTISNLYGWVYGFGSSERPGAYLLNNPHSQGLKVSLGDHRPGTVAMYRFMTPPEKLLFQNYFLIVQDEGLRHPWRLR